MKNHIYQFAMIAILILSILVIYNHKKGKITISSPSWQTQNWDSK